MLSVREKRRLFDSKPGGKGFGSSPPIKNPAERGGTLRQAAINFCASFSAGFIFFAFFGRSFRRGIVYFRAFRRVVVKIKSFRRVIIRMCVCEKIPSGVIKNLNFPSGITHTYTHIHIRTRMRKERNKQRKKKFLNFFIQTY